MWNQPVNKTIKQAINESNKQAANDVIYLCVKLFSCILCFINPPPNMAQHVPSCKNTQKNSQSATPNAYKVDTNYLSQC